MILKNKKGFTLIELLAVIVILGILMLVAIPLVSKYINNSRKDTFINTAKTYVDAVRTAYNADNIECLHRYDGTVWMNASTVENGTLYISFIFPEEGSYWNTAAASTIEAYGDPIKNAKKLMDSTKKSPWNNNIAGLIAIEKTNGSSVYKVSITDGKHNISSSSYPYVVDSTQLKRSNVKDSTNLTIDWGLTRPKYSNLDNQYCCRLIN